MRLLMVRRRRSPHGSHGSNGFHGCSTDSIPSVLNRSIRVHPGPNNDARRMEATDQRIPRMQHRFDLIRAKPFDLSSSVAQQRRSPHGSRGSRRIPRMQHRFDLIRAKPFDPEFIRGPTTTLAVWKPRVQRIPQMQHRFDPIRGKPFDPSSSVAQQRRSPHGSHGSDGFHGCSTNSILSVVTRSIRVHPWPNNDARRMEAAGPADSTDAAPIRSNPC
jgi:hypothetical protein